MIGMIIMMTDSRLLTMGHSPAVHQITLKQSYKTGTIIIPFHRWGNRDGRDILWQDTEPGSEPSVGISVRGPGAEASSMSIGTDTTEEALG